MPSVPTIRTAPVTAAGLIGGYLTAVASGNRPLGGLVFAAAGALCAPSWYRTAGTAVGTGLVATYVAALAGSHPLAKVLGAWPSVFAVSAVAAGAAHLAVDRRQALVLR